MASLYLTSRMLPVPHGFSTRQGGVSRGHFSSLNTGTCVGDELAHVRQNVARLAACVALVEGSVFHTAEQIHGDGVVEVNSSRPAAAPPRADALWAGAPEVAVGVKTADCVPALLVDPRKKRVAAVHSGWRGTELLIVEKAIAALVAQGTNPSDVLAAVGPSIRRCCYQVSPELAARFSAQFGAGVTSFEQGRPHLDLAGAVAFSLQRAGVPKQNIDLLPRCTACDAKLFFSHRRDRGLTGRHLNFVVCRF